MSSATSGTIPPPVSWAQNPELLYVIIDVECKDFEHKVTENTFNFKGVNALDATKKYDVTLNFLKSVDPESVTLKNIGRCLEFKINKKESGPYWASLTNDKTKLHFLKPNFSKWKNESDDEDGGGRAAGITNFNDIMKPDQLWDDKFDDFNYEDDEDSDDNIPSLIQNEDEEDEEAGDKEKKDESANKET